MNPDLERLVGRAVIDKAFREKLLDDPEQAVRDAGLSLSDKEMERLKAGIEKIKSKQTSQQIDRQFAQVAAKWL